jgi:hypothetical protein
LTIDGLYKINGIIGDSIPVFGDGKFWLNLIDFKLAISAIIKFEYPKLRLTSLNIDIKLRKLQVSRHFTWKCSSDEVLTLQNHFDNLMRDEEIGELFNKAISKMAPEAVDMLWPDVKKPVEEQIKNVSFYYFLRPLKHPLATDVMIKVMQG